MSNTTQAVLDLSTPTVRLTVYNSATGTWHEGSQTMRNRDAASLLPWLLANLQEWQINLEDIAFWTCGGGPGSFTGMRLAAALIAGLSYNNSHIQTRTVPTAIAYAARLSGASETPEGSKAQVLFDGRNAEFLAVELEFKDGEWQVASNDAEIYNASTAPEFLQYCSSNNMPLTADLCYQGALSKLLGEDTIVQYLEAPDLQAMSNCRYREFDNDMTSLMYVRPAVFTTPR